MVGMRDNLLLIDTLYLIQIIVVFYDLFASLFPSGLLDYNVALTL